MRKEEIRVTDSSEIAAFASLHLKIPPQPFVRSEDGRIAWRFSRDISPAIAALYTDIPVPIWSFIRELKAVRGTIFTLKRAGAGYGKTL
ncbi:MAG: hypothetical protein HPY65_00710 [Syntrophaceae bacterium]|nr:hypothetical protein [Syntrophaceae bacterium]